MVKVGPFSFEYECGWELLACAVSTLLTSEEETSLSLNSSPALSAGAVVNVVEVVVAEDILELMLLG